MTFNAFKRAYRLALRSRRFSQRSDILGGQPVRVCTETATFCPITAVCYQRTGIHYLPYETNSAANQIGLSSALAFLIVCAADHRERGLKGTLTRWLQDVTMHAIRHYCDDYEDT